MVIIGGRVMFLPSHTIQRYLKRLCRAIQCCSTVGLVIFIVFVYFTSVGTKRDGDLQADSVLVPVPSRTACSSSMFATRDGCVPCPRGKFSFPGWSECMPWLNCSEIALQVHPRKRMSGGATKLVWHADWKGHKVVFINCSATSVRKRNACAYGMSVMERIQGEFVTHLIGNCPEKLQVSHHRKGGEFLLIIFLC